MQQLDTLKISIPRSAVRHVNRDCFIETTKTDIETGSTETYQQAKSASLPPGFSSLIYRDGGEYQLKYSAKVLKDEYLDGITINNWDKCFETLKPIIDVDTNRVYDTGKVFLCDSTNNISLDAIGVPSTKVYPALLAAKSNQRFLPVSYFSKKKQGIEFRGIQQEKNRMIVYAKHLDLLKAANRSFMQSLKNPAKVIQAAEKSLRFEVNHTALRSIRQRFDCADVYLKSVLNSTAPVNHNFLKKILNVSDVKQTAMFDELEDFKSNGGDGLEFIVMVGVQTIIARLDCNDVMVKSFFQQVFPNPETFKNYWYGKGLKKYSIKSILESMQQQKYNVSGNDIDNICNKVLIELFNAVAA